MTNEAFLAGQHLSHPRLEAVLIPLLGAGSNE